MRIATYNIWNSERGMPERAGQIVNEILRLDAEVIGLQEVSAELWQRLNAAGEAYPHVVYCQYPGENEGLAMLSKLPVRTHHFLCDGSADGCAALHVLLEAAEGMVSVTNVHLPWDSCKERERQAVAVNAFIARQQARHYFLLGDFNADMNDSVDRFLRGNQTLHGEEASPCWCDLASAAAARKGETPACTLDMLRNPRWAGQKSFYTPSVMDRIYLRDTWDNVALHDVVLFGCEISPVNGCAPSDHWGVAADITF